MKPEPNWSLLEEAVRELRAIPQWRVTKLVRWALREFEALLRTRRPKLTLIRGGKS